MVVLTNNIKLDNNCKLNNKKGEDAMLLAMPNIKKLLSELRENDWYITAFPFVFADREYAVVFEDLREIDKGTKYFAVCLTFIDRNDDTRRLETYVNAYKFQRSKEELIKFFGIKAEGYSGGNMIWQLYNAFNEATPTKFSPIEERDKKYAVDIIDNREGNEGLCCYMARHNGKKANGEQKHRSAKNTAKTRLLRPELYDLIGEDYTISFYYRQENELDDATILMTLNNSQNKK